MERAVYSVSTPCASHYHLDDHKILGKCKFYRWAYFEMMKRSVFNQFYSEPWQIYLKYKKTL